MVRFNSLKTLTQACTWDSWTQRENCYIFIVKGLSGLLLVGLWLQGCGYGPPEKLLHFKSYHYAQIEP